MEQRYKRIFAGQIIRLGILNAILFYFGIKSDLLVAQDDILKHGSNHFVGRRLGCHAALKRAELIKSLQQRNYPQNYYFAVPVPIYTRPYSFSGMNPFSGYGQYPSPYAAGQQMYTTPYYTTQPNIAQSIPAYTIPTVAPTATPTPTAAPQVSERSLALSLGDLMVLAASIKAARFNEVDTRKFVEATYPNLTAEAYNKILNNPLIVAAINQVKEEGETKTTTKAPEQTNVLTLKDIEAPAAERRAGQFYKNNRNNDYDFDNNDYESNDFITSMENQKDLKHSWCAIFRSHPLCK